MLRAQPSQDRPTTSASILERTPLSSQGNFGNMVGFEMREVEIGKLGCVATFPLLGVSRRSLLLPSTYGHRPYSGTGHE